MNRKEREKIKEYISEGITAKRAYQLTKGLRLIGKRKP